MGLIVSACDKIRSPPLAPWLGKLFVEQVSLGGIFRNRHSSLFLKWVQDTIEACSLLLGTALWCHRLPNPDIRGRAFVKEVIRVVGVTRRLNRGSRLDRRRLFCEWNSVLLIRQTIHAAHITTYLPEAFFQDSSTEAWVICYSPGPGTSVPTPQHPGCVPHRVLSKSHSFFNL